MLWDVVNWDVLRWLRCCDFEVLIEIFLYVFWDDLGVDNYDEPMTFDK